MATAFWKKDPRAGRKTMLVVRWRGADGQTVEERRPNDRHKKQALEYARDRERQADLQNKGLAIEVVPVSFGDLWDEWWERDGQHRRSNSKHAFRSSLQKNLAELRSFVLRPATAGAFAAELDSLLTARETSGALGPATLNHLRAGVHRMFEFGKDPKAHLWTGDNPVQWVKRRKVPRTRKDTLAHHEVKPTLDALPEPVLGAPWRWAAAICLYGGTRPGEAFGLHKADVDIAAGVLTVRYSWESPMPKDDEPRQVLIVPELRPYLEAAIAASKSTLVLPRADGSPFKDTIRANLVDHLRRAIGKAGLVTGYLHICRRCKATAKRTGDKDLQFNWEHPDAEQRECAACRMMLWIKPLPRQLRFYDLRHSHATLLRRGGVDLGTVSKALGHADPRITAQAYDHTEIEDQRAKFGQVLSFNPSAIKGAPAVRETAEVESAQGPAQISSTVAGVSLLVPGRSRTCDLFLRRADDKKSTENHPTHQTHGLDESDSWVEKVHAPAAQFALTGTGFGGAGGARTREMGRRARLLLLRIRYAGAR